MPEQPKTYSPADVPAKLSELLAELPPLADDALPDEIPDVPPEPIETF